MEGEREIKRREQRPGSRNKVWAIESTQREREKERERERTQSKLQPWMYDSDLPPPERNFKNDKFTLKNKTLSICCALNSHHCLYRNSIISKQ